MIRAFWLLPVGIVTTILIIIMYIIAGTSASSTMPGGPEHFILLLIGEGPLIAFFILNVNHRKREAKLSQSGGSQEAALLRREIELLEKGLRDKDVVIESLRGR